MHPRNTLIQLSAVILALAATPKLLSETFTTLPVLAQSSSPTAFPLPSSLPSGTTVKVDGSPSMTAINEALKQRFQQQFSGSTVDLAAGGTDQALQALLDGNITLAAVGRPLTDEEKSKGLVEVPISREKVAIIVGPENPFQGEITFEQFAKIFCGEITDWSELGGPASPIRLVDRPDFSDTRRSLSTYAVFESGSFETGPNTLQVATDETAAIIQELGKDGISYAVADQVLNQSNVKIIPMHGTLPDNPRYPFSQPRGYVYKETPDAAAQAFLGFATSPAGQAAISAAKASEAAETAGAGAEAGTAEAISNPVDSSNAAVTASPDAASNAVISSPEAASGAAITASPSPDTETALAPNAAAAETARGSSLLWLWLLGLPLLGGLLWWLLKGRGSEMTDLPAAGLAAVPVAAVPPVARVPESKMILTPRDCHNAYAYWEVSEDQKAKFREQGGRKLALRLYDVTDIDLNHQIPHSVKQFDCKGIEPDLHVPIAVDNRDYVAELGYVTEDGHWLKIVRSEHVRVPACAQAAVAPQATVPAVEPIAEPTATIDSPTLATGAVLAGGAALAGAAVAKAQAKAPEPPVSVLAEPESRIVLTPHDEQSAYAYWEASDVEKAALRQQGGEQLALRLHDVTGIDPDRQLPPPVQQINCNELEQDRHLSLPAVNRDYLAEVGYLTTDARWLKLARSNAIRLPLVPPMPVSPTTSVDDETVKIAGLGVGAAAAAGAVRTIVSDERPAEIERQQPVASNEIAQALPADTASRCSIKTITVHSRHNSYLLSEAQMRQLQEQTAVTKLLEPGTHLVRIKSGAFGYGALAEFSEPIVLLWIHGGKVINRKTDITVMATWSTLNGYDDTLTLEVQETTTLHAFFFDTYRDDNRGEVTLSVVSLPSV